MVFLLFDGVTLLDVSGPAEVFREAARLGADYRLTFVSPAGSPIRSSMGLLCAVDGAASEISAADTIIVPGADDLPSAPVDAELDAALLHLSQLPGHVPGPTPRIVSICTGSFLLARTGLLAGCRATTHWAHAARLRRACPDATIHEDALYVEDGCVHTSAGVSAGIDLALSLVEADHSRQLAREVARWLVVHLQRSGGQSQFSAALELPIPSEAPVRVAVDAVTRDPAGAHTSASLARAAHVSERHLARLFTDEVGTTPMRFVEDHRLERAKTLLDGASVAEAARHSGFASGDNLRRVFVRRLGVTPSEFRARFGGLTG